MAASLLMIAALPLFASGGASVSSLHSFTGTPDGSSSQAGLVLWNGKLWGTTTQGGANSTGSIFTIAPGGAVVKVADFPPCCTNPASPVGTMVVANGSLWGLTSGGGAYSNGTVFQFDGSSITTVHDFIGGTDGAVPESSLVNVGGVLYGTTELGGANGGGTFFKVDPSTSTVSTDLADFANGALPFGDLALAADGTTVYGTTDGSNEIYRFDTTTNTLAASVATLPGSSLSGLTTTDGANFFGTTYNGGAGKGTVFKFIPPCTSISGTYDAGNGTDGNSATPLNVSAGPWTLTATNTTFSYVEYVLNQHPTFAQIQTLAANFTSNSGGSGGGSPRIGVVIDYNNNGVIDGGDKEFLIYLGNSPAFTDTDTVLNTYSGANLIGNNDAGRYDLTPGGLGPLTNYSGALAVAGQYPVLALDIIEDTFGAFPSRNLTFNGFSLCAAAVTPTAFDASGIHGKGSLAGLTPRCGLLWGVTAPSGANPGWAYSIDPADTPPVPTYMVALPSTAYGPVNDLYAWSAANGGDGGLYGTALGPNGNAYEVYPAPIVTTILPSSAGSNTGVTINGSGFTGAADVSFGATSVPFTVVNDTQITTTTPNPAASSSTVTVTSSCDTVVTSNFCYDDAPQVTASADTNATAIHVLWDPAHNGGSFWAAQQPLGSAVDPNGDSMFRNGSVTQNGITLSNFTIDGQGNIFADVLADCSVQPNAYVTVPNLVIFDNPAGGATCRLASNTFNVVVIVDNAVTTKVTWIDKPGGPPGGIDAGTAPLLGSPVPPVPPITSTQPVGFGQIITLKVQVDISKVTQLPAKVIWNDNTIEWTDSNGTVTRQFPGSGSWNVGDNYLWIKSVNDCAGLASAGFDFQIGAGATKVALTAIPSSSVYGQTVTFKATVTSNTGNPTDGAVKFEESPDSGANWFQIGSNASVDPGGSGVATVTSNTLVPGSYMLRANYIPGSKLANMYPGTASLTVGKDNTSITVTSNHNPTTGSPNPPVITYTATLLASTPGTAIDDPLLGSVTFYDGNTTLGDGNATFVPISGSVPAKWIVTLVNPYGSAVPPGTHAIKAVFNGDAHYNGSTSPNYNQTFNPDYSTTSALGLSSGPYTTTANITMTGTVTNPSGLSATGTLVFYDSTDNATFTAIGSASAAGGPPTTGNILKKLPAGNHWLYVKYNPSGLFLGSQSPTTMITVNKADATVTLVATPSSSTLGQTVSFKATVSGGGATPTGTVTFFDGNSTVTTVALSGGIATKTLSTLSVGGHDMTAVYNGDGTYNSGPYGEINPFTVGKGNVNLSLSATPASSVVTQSKTFIINISAASPATSSPTGTVDIKEGATTLCSITLPSTNCSTSTLSAATHVVSAHYNGDSTFNVKDSATISFAVSKASTSTALTIIPGSPNQASVTVSPASPAVGPPDNVSVQIKEGASVIATVTLTCGATTCSGTGNLNVLGGTHTVVALYPGSSNFNASTSSSKTFTASVGD